MTWPANGIRNPAKKTVGLSAAENRRDRFAPSRIKERIGAPELRHQRDIVQKDVPFQLDSDYTPNRPTRLADGLGLESAPIHSHESTPLNSPWGLSAHRLGWDGSFWRIRSRHRANSLGSPLPRGKFSRRIRLHWWNERNGRKESVKIGQSLRKDRPLHIARLCQSVQSAIQFSRQEVFPSKKQSLTHRFRSICPPFRFFCDHLTPSPKPHTLNHMVKYLPPPLDRLFFALSDPTRRAIVARLSQGDVTIAALAAPFAMSLVAVSKHIRVLEQAGLLTRTKLGREFHLRLVPQPLQAAADWIDQFEQFWTQHLDHVKARAEQKAPAARCRERETSAIVGCIRINSPIDGHIPNEVRIYFTYFPNSRRTCHVYGRSPERNSNIVRTEGTSHCVRQSTSCSKPCWKTTAHWRA